MYDHITKTDLHDEGHLHYFTYKAMRKLLIERCEFSYIKEYSFGKFGKMNYLLRYMLSECCIVAVR